MELFSIRIQRTFQLVSTLYHRELLYWSVQYRVPHARGLPHQYRYKHRYSFRIVANPLHEQVGPNGDNHLDGYGIDAPINLRQLHIKHLRAYN